MTLNLTKTFHLELLNALGTSSTAERNVWANYILEHQISPSDLISILFEEKPTSVKFSWLLGGLCEREPKMFLPHIVPIFNNRSKVNVPNFERSLARMMSFAGVPEEIEGEAVDNLFKWLLAPNRLVTTKTYAMITLFNLCDKYEDLKGELKFAVEDQYDKNTASFKTRARKILVKL